MTFYMCDPAYFGVEYSINYYMNPDLWTARQKYLRMAALPLWKELKETLLRLNQKVQLVSGVKGLPDMCFAANAGLVCGNTVLLSRFKNEERRGEEAYWLNYFKDLLFDIAQPKSIFEGQGDCKWDSYHDCFWMGYGQRTDMNSMVAVMEVFDKEVIPLHLIDPRYYHLDLAFCPLSSGYVVWYPPAFDEDSQGIIKTMFPDSRRITLSEYDMITFSGNIIEVVTSSQKYIIGSYIGGNFKFALNNANYHIMQIPLDPFHFAGGSAACLVLQG